MIISTLLFIIGIICILRGWVLLTNAEVGEKGFKKGLLIFIAGIIIGMAGMVVQRVEFDEEVKKGLLTGKTTASLSQITVAMSTLPQTEGVLKIKYKTQNANSGKYSAPLMLGKPAGSDAFIQRNIIIGATARSEQIIFIKSEAN